MNDAVGLIVMAHGTPKSENEFEDFLTSIRRGRKPEPELIAEVKRRYGLIGGVSPLSKNTQAFFDSFEKSILEAATSDLSESKFVLTLGYKHVEPSIYSAIKSLAETNIHKIFGIIASAYYSTINIEDYNSSVLKSLEQIDRRDITYKSLPALCSLHGYAELISIRLDRLLKESPNAPVIFSAHSLPIAALNNDRSYQDQHETLAKTIARQCNLKQYIVAYQSGTLGAGEWLGPDVNDVIKSGQIGDANEVIVAPIGFISDHAEILFDLDIELKATCKLYKIKYSRIQMLNDSPDFIELLKKASLQYIKNNA